MACVILASDTDGSPFKGALSLGAECAATLALCTNCVKNKMMRRMHWPGGPGRARREQQMRQVQCSRAQTCAAPLLVLLGLGAPSREPVENGCSTERRQGHASTTRYQTALITRHACKRHKQWWLAFHRCGNAQWHGAMTLLGRRSLFPKSKSWLFLDA